MKVQRLAWSSLVVSVLSVLPSIARADPAAAEELFREGRRLLDQGETDRACLKLAESQAQDPSSGTLLNLALCHEKQNKLATAWSEYVSSARLARDQGRVDRALVAEQKAAELEPRLPRLNIVVGVEVPGLEIFRDDHRLGPGLLGSPIPVDPGTYVISATAPGRAAWSQRVAVTEAESKTVQVPELTGAVPPAPPSAQETSNPPPLRPGAPPAAPDPGAASTPSSGHRGPLGWILGAAGIATIGVGAGFGFISLASYRHATSACPSHADCAPDALTARSRAEWQAWVSDVTLGAGIVATTIGAYIFVRDLHDPRPTRVVVGCSSDLAAVGVSIERSF
jgi:hypothetical protein